MNDRKVSFTILFTRGNPNQGFALIGVCFLIALGISAVALISKKHTHRTVSQAQLTLKRLNEHQIAEVSVALVESMTLGNVLKFNAQAQPVLQQVADGVGGGANNQNPEVVGNVLHLNYRPNQCNADAGCAPGADSPPNIKVRFENLVDEDSSFYRGTLLIYQLKNDGGYKLVSRRPGIRLAKVP